MRTVSVQPCMRLPLGKQGENEAVQVIWAGIVEQFRELYGEGVFTLTAKRCGDAEAYPVAVSAEGGDVVWLVQAADVASPGSGSCELTYTVDGVVAKSQTWSTYVAASISGDAPGEPPEEPAKAWFTAIQTQIGKLDDLTTKAKANLVAAINEAAKTGSGSAGSISMRTAGGYIQYSTDDGETWENLIALAELKGEPGQDGKPGKDGADGAPGKDGTPGADGYSPTAKVEETADGAKITITDKDGTTEATVKNGKDAVEITCNAADYGVSPDAADNSASLLLAIQAAQEQNAVVYIPEGEYIFTTPITLPSNSNIQMIGSNDAFASSMNRENVSGEMHPIASGTTLIYRGDGAFMRHTGCVFSLKNLQLVSQDANKAYLYKARAIGQTALDNTTKGKIYAENCLFAGWKTVSGDAFVTSDLETALGGTLTKPDTLEQCCIVATRCRFSFCGAAINMGVDSRLVDCSINKCYYGAAFYGSAGFSTLSNCRIEWCAYDGVIGNQAHDILISGCEFDRCGHAAVRLTSCTGCTIAGNVMRRSGADSTVSAESSTNNVHLYIKSCTGGAITGNTTVAKNIMDDGSSTTKRPTNAYSITDNTDLTITGNDFSGRTTGTYNKLSGNTDCHLSANIGMENDSASNLSLGLTGATVGQIAKISAVDENGKPTAWEPADLPSGGGGDWVFAGSVTAESAGMALKVSNIHAKHILVSLYASCDDTSSKGYTIVFNDVLTAQHANSLPGNSVKHLWAVEFDLLAAGDKNYIYSRVWPTETHHTNTSNDPQTIMNTTTLAGTMWYKVGISEFNSVTFASTNGTASAGNIMNVWYR